MKIYTNEGFLYKTFLDNKESPRFLKRKMIKIIKIDEKIIAVGATDIENKNGFFKLDGCYYRIPLRLKTIVNNKIEFIDIEDGTEFFTEHYLNKGVKYVKFS